MTHRALCERRIPPRPPVQASPRSPSVLLVLFRSSWYRLVQVRTFGATTSHRVRQRYPVTRALNDRDQCPWFGYRRRFSPTSGAPKCWSRPPSVMLPSTTAEKPWVWRTATPTPITWARRFRAPCGPCPRDRADSDARCRMAGASSRGGRPSSRKSAAAGWVRRGSRAGARPRRRCARTAKSRK